MLAHSGILFCNGLQPFGGSPLVQATLLGLRRILAKPKASKEPSKHILLVLRVLFTFCSVPFVRYFGAARDLHVPGVREQFDKARKYNPCLPVCVCLCVCLCVCVCACVCACVCVRSFHLHQ